MKLFRRASAFTMVLALLLSLSINVWAVDYDAANIDELSAAFGDTSGEDVNINLTDSIDAGYWGMESQDGINYNISSENGSTLSNAGFGGEGSVTVDADVSGCIFGYGEADVTVNGTVDGDVSASGNSSVAVDGDVNGNVIGIENADIAVEGDVDGYVNAMDEASVAVSGNVSDGVSALDESSVTVDGDVAEYVSTDGNAEAHVGGSVDGNVDAMGSSSVAVDGDVNGQVYASENGTASVGGDVNGSVTAFDEASVDVSGSLNNEDGWTGIYADGQANVNVDGDVTSSSDGVYAWSDAAVTVGGSVTAGSDIVHDDMGYVSGGSAINASDNATVTVNGDAVGGDASGESGASGGTAVSVWGNATVAVTGDVVGGDASGDGYAYGGTGVSAWSNADSAPTVSVGGDVAGGNASSTSEETFAAQGGMGLQMSGSSNVTVGGGVAGGNSEGETTVAMPGVLVDCRSGTSAGSLNVGGAVTGGEGSEDLGDLYVSGYYDPETGGDVEVPEIIVGSVDSVVVSGFTEEDAAKIKAEIKANQTKVDTFLADVLWLVRNAEPGDEITVDAGGRRVITKAIIEAVRECEVTLIIKWNGGDDLVIDKTFTAEFEEEYIQLAEIAELLKN